MYRSRCLKLVGNTYNKCGIGKISLMNRYSTAVRLEPCQSEKMTDIGTRQIFDSDHDLFRENVRRFFQENVVPYEPEWMEQGRVSRECWIKAGDAGLLGASTPAEKGGIGCDWLHSAIVQEEQSYANSSGPGFSLHSDIVMPYISKYGTKEQIEKYIPDMVAGTKIGAIAMTEPGAGSDLQGIRTNAVRDGDYWVLNGSKIYITNGYLCDFVIVVSLTSRDAKSAAGGISLLCVDKDTVGFTKGKVLNKLGLKAQDTSELFFDNARIPYGSVLGGEAGENAGFSYLMNELPQERLLIANYAVSSSEYLFEITREYVKERKAFGRRIADLQTIQHGLAEIKTEIAIIRAFVDRCNDLHNRRLLDTSTASMAKYYSSEKVNRHAYKLMQMFGGSGYMQEYPICKAYADVRIHPIYGGTNEIMKEIISRQIVK